MTSHLRRRITLAMAAVVGLTAVAAAATAAVTVPAVASAPVKSPYTCTAAALNGQKLNISFEVSTSAPDVVYIGKTANPKLIVKATIPGNIVGLAAFFGVKSASATGTFTVKINDVASPRPLTFPRTDIPQTAKDFPVLLKIPLPQLAPTAPGTVVYKPGPIALTLTGYNKKVADAQPGDDVGSVDAECTSNSPNQVIDTVTFAKSPTTLSTAASYSKAAKKVSSAARVVPTSGVPATGKVTSVLYRGQTKIGSVTSTLVNGKASAVFTGVTRTGAYKVVSTYGGSSALKGSTKTQALTVK